MEFMSTPPLAWIRTVWQGGGLASGWDALWPRGSLEAGHSGPHPGSAPPPHRSPSRPPESPAATRSRSRRDPHRGPTAHAQRHRLEAVLTVRQAALAQLGQHSEAVVHASLKAKQGGLSVWHPAPVRAEAGGRLQAARLGPVSVRPGASLSGWGLPWCPPLDATRGRRQAEGHTLDRT